MHTISITLKVLYCMSAIILIKNFQLYWLDIPNKTAKIMDHEHSDKNFILVSESYAVDDNHNIYKIDGMITSSYFNTNKVIDGTTITFLKIIHNNIFYIDTSDIAHVIYHERIIRLNNITRNNIGNIKLFFVHPRLSYILVAYIINTTFFIECSHAYSGIIEYKSTYQEDNVQDFNFSNSHIYVIKNNIVYYRVTFMLVNELYYYNISGRFEVQVEKFLKFYEFVDNYKNVIVIYKNRHIINSNYISNSDSPTICIQDKDDTIVYEYITSNLHHFKLSSDEKYSHCELIKSNIKKYYHNHDILIIVNNDELDVFLIQQRGLLTKIFSVEGNFYYENNRTKSSNANH